MKNIMIRDLDRDQKKEIRDIVEEYMNRPAVSTTSASTAIERMIRQFACEEKKEPGVQAGGGGRFARASRAGRGVDNQTGRRGRPAQEFHPGAQRFHAWGLIANAQSQIYISLPAGQI